MPSDEKRKQMLMGKLIVVLLDKSCRNKRKVITINWLFACIWRWCCCGEVWAVTETGKGSNNSSRSNDGNDSDWQ